MFNALFSALGQKKKAPIFGAFFIAAALAYQALSHQTLAFQAGSSAASWEKVKYVIDGDTFALASGDKVRMVGINTPELGHGKKPDEPLGNIAKKYLEGQIKGQSVQLVFGKEKKDKYGRLLARVKTESGKDMQVELLRRGLAFAIAVGRDLEGLDELLAAEQEARADDKGVWGYKYYDPIKLKRGMPEKKGYTRIVAKVKRVSDSRKYKTIWLTDRFRVLVPHENWRKYWSKSDKKLKGKTIEARGWVFTSKGTAGMKVYHPSMIDVIGS